MSVLLASPKCIEWVAERLAEGQVRGGPTPLEVILECWNDWSPRRHVPEHASCP